ncbi:MAG: hypothetical protein IT197_09060 [Acidimicrobiia bacterium]|nr:hypothetical protein [Acidimicrobiia bacterium]
MATMIGHEGHEDGGRETLEELEEEARLENPDPITEREAFELALLEEGRSAEGSGVALERDTRS